MKNLDYKKDLFSEKKLSVKMQLYAKHSAKRNKEGAVKT